ncbi:MAG TPA: type I glutamate--ammonia ligase [Thermoleophilia bacterium]|mgnify:FL=1|nr:type I glutamate--ammonia ligase [Thermoleophilia bacterium]
MVPSPDSRRREAPLPAVIPDTPVQLLSWIRDAGVEMVNLRVTDLNGLTRQLSFPPSAVDEELLTAGTGAGMSNYPGYRTIEASDMRMVPDLPTAFLDPSTETKTLDILCTIRNADGSEFSRCPRSILRRAVERLSAVAGKGRLMVLPELEFYVFDDVRYASAQDRQTVVIDAEEASWNSDSDEWGPNSGYHLGRAVGQHAAPPRDHLYELRADIVWALGQCGVPVKYHHHELGGPGQVEIEFRFEPALLAGDHMQMAKDVIKSVALSHGKTATFMPKPLHDEAGNGMHFHLYLKEGDRSLFYEEGTYASLSEPALYAIGGLLQHTPAMMAICNPSTNSFRRFAPGLAAPVHLFFGLANRSAALRIPAYGISPTAQRIEYRMADPIGNPYLTLATVIAAMADGIEKRMSPKELGFGPFDVNVYTLPEAEQVAMKQAPTSLQLALEALREDHDFLTATGIVDEAFVDDWVDLKMRNEVGPMAVRPHPYEFALYYDR